MDEFPQLTWLKWQLLEAEDMTRRLTWNPITAADILKIAGDRDARLVQNGDALLEAVMESLKNSRPNCTVKRQPSRFFGIKAKREPSGPKTNTPYPTT